MPSINVSFSVENISSNQLTNQQPQWRASTQFSRVTRDHCHSMIPWFHVKFYTDMAELAF